jgi:hypothetical protein
MISFSAEWGERAGGGEEKDRGISCRCPHLESGEETDDGGGARLGRRQIRVGGVEVEPDRRARCRRLPSEGRSTAIEH